MATAGRIIIETTTSGWYEDPEQPGKKVRKQNGDRVMSRAEYDQLVLDREDSKETPVSKAPTAEQVAETQATTAAANKATRKAAAQAAKPEPVKTTLTSGKEAVGKTIEIRCAWVDPEKRTEAQQELFNSGFAGVEPGKAYEAVKEAAGNKRSAFPDGSKRTIKVQDAFQVRFSPDNQKRWRNELRRRKTAARKAEREAAKAAA